MGAYSTADFSICDLKFYFFSTYSSVESSPGNTAPHSTKEIQVIQGPASLAILLSQSKFLFWIVFSGLMLFLQPGRLAVCLFLSFPFFFKSVPYNKGAEWWGIGICLICHWSSCWGRAQCGADQDPTESNVWSDVLEPLGWSPCGHPALTVSCWLLSLWQTTFALPGVRVQKLATL